MTDDHGSITWESTRNSDDQRRGRQHWPTATVNDDDDRRRWWWL